MYNSIVFFFKYFFGIFELTIDLDNAILGKEISFELLLKFESSLKINDSEIGG
ncbi:MAG: hypothetical protein RBT56_08865 [Ignavibacteriaceae bacterium]|nr:hypothetical protein [Ignavibacteriaceae bacterium]